MKPDRRLLALLRDGPLRTFALTVTLGVLTGVLIVLQAALLSAVLDAVFLHGAGLPQVRAGLLWLVGVLILRGGTVWGQKQAAFELAAQVKRRLRARLFTQLVSLGPTYTGSEQSGELINALTQGLDDLGIYLQRYLPQLFIAACVPLLMVAVVLPRDWISALILLLTAPLIPLFMWLIGEWADALTRRQWTQLSRMRAFLLDALQGLTALKRWGQAAAHLQRVAETSDAFRRATMRVLRVAFLSALVLEWVATLSTAVVSVGIGLRLLAGQLDFREAFFVLLLAPEFYQPLRSLGTSFHAGMSGAAAAERVFQILETPAPAPPASTQGLDGPPRCIRFEHVSFAYPGSDQPALRDVSFTLRAGQRVALVGPSGAGKSTVLALLLRFVTPQSGRILVDGHPLAEIPAAEWVRYLAWVPQRPTLFQGTIAANLRLARPQASSEELERAVRQAHFDEVLRRLPQGYQTILGERGITLSGGQAQRLALARAFLKDAPLLLLDEPTSRLDPDNEAHLQAALARLLSGRTVLVIAHRPGTVQQADVVLVLEHGRITRKNRAAAT